MEFTTYIKFYELYRAEKINALLAYKTDTELTHAEKELFAARLLMRSKDWEGALEKLEAIKTEIPFLKGERYFLMAHINLIKSDFEESAKFGNLAVRYYEEIFHKEGLFKSFYNLSVAFNRIGMDSLSDFFLIQAEKHVETSRQKFIMDRARACAYSKNCEFQKAVMTLDLMFKSVDDEFIFEVEAFKIVAADIYFRAGDVEKARKVINDIMNTKRHPERGRALFYFHMLALLEEDKKLPAKPKSVGLIPEFNTQWDLIVAITEGETEIVTNLWNEIMTEYPKYFAADFKSIDNSEEKTLFYAALQKMILSKPKATVDLSGIKGKKSKRLIELLLNSQTPMRKEVLIEEIWGESYSPFMDSRFYKLVERSRGLIALHIKNEHNAYFLAA